MDHDIVLQDLEVNADHNLVVHWGLQFDAIDPPALHQPISWAKGLPTPHSTRPHVLVSDTLSNYVLYRLWAGGLAKSLPDSWIARIKQAVAMSGFELKGMGLGMPPVVQPDGENGLRLLLPEIRVQLKEDDTLRTLH